MSKRRSSYGPALGESLQSFIFRVLYRTGYSNFSTVLTKGGWGSRPSVPIFASKEFEVFSSHELLRVYEANIFYGQKDSIFNGHFKHLFPPKKYSTHNYISFREVFYPAKEKQYAGVSIMVRYCADCISLQIKQNGFAFFRIEWSYQVRCEIHSKPLLGLSPLLSLSRIAEGVHQVLKGEVPCHSRELTEYDYCNDAEFNFAPISLKLSPCAKTAIVNYLVASCKYYPNGYTELVDYGFLTVQGKIIFSKWRLREHIKYGPYQFIEGAIEQDHDAVMEFLNEKMELVKVTYLDEFIKINDRWLLKNKDINCSKCAVTHSIGFENCSASKLIYLPIGPWAIFRFASTQQNMCERKLKEVSEQLQHYQDSTVYNLIIQT